MRIGFLVASFLLGFVLVSSNIQAADIIKGKKLYRSCALCHGQLGQGAEGGKYPRVAGLREDYLVKQLNDYKKGDRANLTGTMTLVGQIKNMSEEDMLDLATYIRSINLKSKAYTLNIATAKGNVKAGKKLYKGDGDCKGCHGKKGEGKARKGAPMIAGQYTKYLLNQIAMFRTKERLHDNDEDDETFKELSSEQIQNIMAYLSTLDDK